MDRTKNKHSSHSDYDLSADLEKIKNALADASYDVKGKASEIFSESLQNAKLRKTELEDGVAKYVADKPFKTIGIAAITGFVLGYFIRK